MRRLLTLACEGSQLGASLDEADGRTGVLIVTGGSQTRIGSHRIFERLARSLAENGYSCLRFDRRGVGDSDGEDPDFRANGADIAAAAAALREQCPGVGRIVGFGLCDGASSLALFGADAGLAGLIMVNPWLVEAESGAPPPAAIRHHYRQRLMTLDGWRKLLGGSVSYTKLFRGLVEISRPQPPSSLATDVGEALRRAALPVELILARHDATAVAAAHVWNSAAFARHFETFERHVTQIETDSHTFARPGDPEALAAAVLAALGRIEARQG
ncbi:MAG: hydrolase 1, exosortase system-associated [Alphaproteobacteria bacterium]|nr:hydrolase 1, exosortase system-associated [Alphaproteobacteria bacterium]